MNLKFRDEKKKKKFMVKFKYQNNFLLKILSCV